MEAIENPRVTPPHKHTLNPNLKPTNINMEIDESLTSLRTLLTNLQSTRDPSWLPLANYLDTQDQLSEVIFVITA